MKKAVKWIILILLLLMAAFAAAVVFFYILPYRNAESTMPEEDRLTLSRDAEGNVELRWPEAQGQDYYCLELQRPMKPGQEVPEVIFREYVREASCMLPSLPEDMELVVQINTVVEYETAGELRQRMGETPLRQTLTLGAPVITELQWTPDPEADTVSLSWKLQNATHCRLYLAENDSKLTLLQTLTGEETLISFGEGADLPMPERGQTYRFVLEAYRQEPGLEFCNIPTGELSVCREDLLGRDLRVVCTDLGNNVCSLSWQETKGEYYLVQEYDPESLQWSTLCRIEQEESLTYTTGHLENLSQFRFRVAAVGGQTLEDTGFAAVSGDCDFSTGLSPMFCTVWPVSDLEGYSAPSGGEVVGNVTAAKAYCVLDYKEGMFGVLLNGHTCYIDSNYCMINLPELLGSLCSYDITNSYASLYKVHEYEIPEVTDTVILGYEAVATEEGDFLVPLLYPTTQKLLKAAQEAMARGYRLKIYDAYRPNEATLDIFSRTETILEDPIPEKPFSGDVPSDLPQTEEGEEITYKLLMTNNEWNLANFLARGVSRHNLGVALDLTLETLEGGEELQMQTAMHDLSWYSVPSRNNTNADILKEIMMNAGMADLISEWWHFQDNEARDTLSLPAVKTGVTPECWMLDDTGWRYRRYNGSYFTSCTRVIDGVTYSFDARGYVME